MRTRLRFTGVVFAAIQFASVVVAQQVVTETGAISGITEDGVHHLQRRPLRCPAGRGLALARSGACCSVDGHAQGRYVCPGVYARGRVHAGRDPAGSE